MKSFYEILEVSENASKDVIEKAYKVLVKKYHPDLQDDLDKGNYEKKMQELNEAFEILSDDIKRKKYDLYISEQKRVQKLKIERQIEEKYKKEKSINKDKNSIDIIENNNKMVNLNNNIRKNSEERLEIERQKILNDMQQQMNDEYQKLYYDYLRSLGFKIKTKWTWKKTKKLIILILSLILLSTCLWFIPSTNKMLINFYEKNSVIKFLIDFVVSVFKSLIQTIKNVFN